MKNLDEEINILLIGSSWGVDSISGLAAVSQNLGIKVNTGNLYKSGGTVSMYMDDIKNNGLNTFYYNSFDGERTTLSKTVLQAVQFKNWDVIILQNGANDSLTENKHNMVFEEYLSYIKYHATNPRVVFALNATWTDKNKQMYQEVADNIVYDLSKQTGIDILTLPGRAINLLRKTPVNDGHDIYRDSLHLNVGVGRFTTACVVFECIVAPIYGISVRNCTFSGSIDYEGAISEAYPRIPVDDSNIAYCIQSAILATTNRFN